jgi:NAD(P)-dependent dehydrogenase (short-subunit alcohol dehydrogenase family)
MMVADRIDALVVGARGGIGGALVEALCDRDDIVSVVATSRSDLVPAHAKITARKLDLLDEASISSVASDIPPPRLIIIATGMLHDDGIAPEKSWRSLSAAAMAQSYAINCIGPALIAKHILPLMPRTGKVVFAALSARVGSIEDNRTGGWHSYRTSKAALNQLIRTLSIEAAMKSAQAICVGLHPGTVATALSAPFAGNVAANKLFTPAQSAAYLLKVIDSLTPADTGKLFGWDGAAISF